MPQIDIGAVNSALDTTAFHIGRGATPSNSGEWLPTIWAEPRFGEVFRDVSIVEDGDELFAAFLSLASAIRRRELQIENQLLFTISDIRKVVGDEGKMMLHELVDHVRSIKQQRDELLEALKECPEELDCHDGNPHCGLTGCTGMSDVIKKCRAAISKAEGMVISDG